MLSKIINYTVRLIFIVLGILFLSGIVTIPNADKSMVAIVGVIFILFGVYRIVDYYSKSKIYSRSKRRGEYDDEE